METERRKETVNDAFSHKTMNGSKKQLILNAADVRVSKAPPALPPTLGGTCPSLKIWLFLPGVL